MRFLTVVLALFALSGCGDDTQHGGGMDLAVPDLATHDMLVPTSCNPLDPMTDGTACSAGCPSTTIGVNLGGSCKCYTKCSADTECSCNRLCDPVTLPDAGVVASACLPGNAPGTRCGRDANMQPFGGVICGQLTTCVNADQPRLFRYCNYKCTVQADCPAQTTCQALMDGSGNIIGSVCAYNSGPNGNKDLGMPCGASDTCKTGQLCDTTCKAQCDGPGGTCATGTCQRLDDPATGRVIGYVCQ
jgi:hypothetical protein